jgi:membrane protein DedA with SNARE-associated domain
MTHFFTHNGLPVLFLAVMIESFGIPVPGETALIAFAVLAAEGHYSISLVILLAATGAIIGDNLGYWVIGRIGGRTLFRRWSWLGQYADRTLPRAERLMARHGGKTVFFGRFIAILRYTAAWVAGIARMPWGRFLFWNAAGGIVWATSVGLIAYYSGQAAATAIQTYGLYAVIAVIATLILGWSLVHYGKRHVERRR